MRLTRLVFFLCIFFGSMCDFHAQCEGKILFERGWGIKDSNIDALDSIIILLTECSDQNNDQVCLLRADILNAYLLKDQNIDSVFLHLTAWQTYTDTCELAPEVKGIYLLTLAQMLKKKGEYESSTKYLELAESLFKEHQITWGYARAIDDKGTNFRKLGNDSLGLEFHLDALRIRGSVGDKEGVIRSNINLGAFHIGQKDFIKAREFCQTARAISLEVGNNQLLISSTMNLAITFFKDSNPNYDSASYFYESVLPATFALKLDRQRAGIYNNLGLLEKKKKNYDKALIQYEQAYKIYFEIGHEKGVKAYYGNAGNIYLKKNNFKTAIDYFEKHESLAQKLGESKSVMKALYNLSRAHNGLGDFEKGHDYFVQYIELRDSLSNDAVQIKLANLDSKFQNEALARTNVELENKTLEQENTILESDATIRTMNIWIIILVGVCVAILSLLQFFRYRHKIKSKLQAKDAQLKATNAMIEGQESERKRIAGELHEGLGATLSATKHQLEAVNMKMDSVVDKNEEFAKATKLLNEAVGEVRRISHNMASAVLVNFGLVEALNDLANNLQTARGLEVNILAVGFEERERPHPKIELTSYRIVQELMQNIVKHAEAKTANVQLRYSDDELKIIVKDDGIGFDLTQAEQSEGIGLKNLKTRVDYLKGELTFDSAAGKGTKATVKFQLNLAD